METFSLYNLCPVSLGMGFDVLKGICFKAICLQIADDGIIHASC